MLVLRTLGAPQRRLLRGRKGKEIAEADAEAVPTSRVTIVRPAPFGSGEEAKAWLGGIRDDQERRESELDAALAVLGRALHAQRVASADSSLPDLSLDRALVTRIGFGAGEEVADGRYESAWELPPDRHPTRRSMEAPEERFAAILAGRERALAAEELVLRARADLDAGRRKEAALGARVALESLLAETASEKPEHGRLEEQRETAGQAANAALRGDLPPELASRLDDAIRAMEGALRRRRLRP